MQSSHKAQRPPSRVASTTNTDVKGGAFKAFNSVEKDTGFTSRKSFIPATPLLSLVTSGFPSMRKLNRSLSWFSIGICLFLSLFFVLATAGLYPSSYLFGYVQFRDLVSRSFGIRSSDSESSTVTKLTVPESTLTSLTRSNQVQFDNYSLILRDQRIFL